MLYELKFQSTRLFTLMNPTWVCYPSDTCIRESPANNAVVVFHKPQSSSDKVILIAGGGSGHEPAHTGFIGEGMLDVAVSGNVFASPSASQILAGLRALPAPRG
jgi:dihydroxyacetone kinase